MIEANFKEIEIRISYMNLNTRDTIMKKLLDAQENIRDYESLSKQVNSKEVKNTFKQFAEETGLQAKKLQELLDNFTE